MSETAIHGAPMAGLYRPHIDREGFAFHRCEVSCLWGCGVLYHIWKQLEKNTKQNCISLFPSFFKLQGSFMRMWKEKQGRQDINHGSSREEGEGDEERKLGFQENGQVQQWRLVSLEESEGVLQGASEKPRVCRKQAGFWPVFRKR